MIKGKRDIAYWVKLKQLWCKALVRQDRTAARTFRTEIESLHITKKWPV